MEKPATPKRTRAPRSHATYTAAETARLAHWRAWWVDRPGGRPSAAKLGERLHLPGRRVHDYAISRCAPTPVTLAALEAASVTDGFEPLPSWHPPVPAPLAGG